MIVTDNPVFLSETQRLVRWLNQGQPRWLRYWHPGRSRGTTAWIAALITVAISFSAMADPSGPGSLLGLFWLVGMPLGFLFPIIFACALSAHDQRKEHAVLSMESPTPHLMITCRALAHIYRVCPVVLLIVPLSWVPSVSAFGIEGTVRLSEPMTAPLLASFVVLETLCAVATLAGACVLSTCLGLNRDLILALVLVLTVVWLVGAIAIPLISFLCWLYTIFDEESTTANHSAVIILFSSWLVWMIVTILPMYILTVRRLVADGK